MSSVLTNEQKDFIAKSMITYVNAVEELIAMDGAKCTKKDFIIFKEGLDCVEKYMKELKKGKKVNKKFEMDVLVRYLGELDKDIEIAKTQKDENNWKN